MVNKLNELVELCELCEKYGIFPNKEIRDQYIEHMNKELPKRLELIEKGLYE